MPPSLKAFAFCRREREAAENERKKCIAPISPAAGFLWASQGIWGFFLLLLLLFVWIIICFNSKGYSCREALEWSRNEKFLACL